MASTTLKTRVQLKYDTYANWTTNNPTPLAGEMCIVVLPADSGQMAQEPAILFKIGDGTTAFNSLPFGSAKAADVYDWAKTSTKPQYRANEIQGLSDYISGQIQDTDTQYKLEQDSSNGHILKLYQKPKGGSWTVLNTITTVDTVYNDTALRNRVTAVEGLVGSTAVATQIANAITALNLANTYDAKGAAANALTQAKAYADGKDAAISSAQAAANAAQADVDGLETYVGKIPTGNAAKTVIAYVDQKVIDGTYNDKPVLDRLSATEAATSANTTKITANTNAIATLNGSATTAGSVAKKVADEIAKVVAGAPSDLDTLKEIADYIASDKTNAAQMTADISKNRTDIATNTSNISSNLTKINTKVDKVTGKGLSTNDFTNAQKTKVDALGTISSLNEIGEGNLASALATKINNKADKSSLATIATSGNVKDLTQTAGDYVIFNCGSSSVLV